MPARIYRIVGKYLEGENFREFRGFESTRESFPSPDLSFLLPAFSSLYTDSVTSESILYTIWREKTFANFVDLSPHLSFPLPGLSSLYTVKVYTGA